MKSEEFYVQMGFLIKQRDHARAMIQKWQEKIDMYEERIEALRKDDEATEALNELVAETQEMEQHQSWI